MAIGKITRSSDDEEPEEEVVSRLPVVATTPALNLLVNAATTPGQALSADAELVLRGFMEAAKYGHQAALPLECKGNKCIIIDMCPLKKIGAPLPKGKPCPVEGALIQQWVIGYIESLGVDPNDPEQAVDMHMIYEAAGLELIRMRTAHYLSKEGEIIKEKIVGYSPQGAAIYADTPSMALMLMEKQSKTMSKIRESLLATRKSQAQVGNVVGDVSIKTANIMLRARELAEKRKKEAIEAQFEVIEDEQPETDI